MSGTFPDAPKPGVQIDIWTGRSWSDCQNLSDVAVDTLFYHWMVNRIQAEFDEIKMGFVEKYWSPCCMVPDPGSLIVSATPHVLPSSTRAWLIVFCAFYVFVGHHQAWAFVICLYWVIWRRFDSEPRFKLGRRALHVDVFITTMSASKSGLSVSLTWSILRQGAHHEYPSMWFKRFRIGLHECRYWGIVISGFY